MEQHRRTKAGMGKIAAHRRATEAEMHLRATLQDRIIALEKALLEYGRHTSKCRFRFGTNLCISQKECICGFNELIERLGL